MEHSKNYGILTIGKGSESERDIPVEEFLVTECVGKRKVSIVKAEGNFVVSIENATEKQDMYLTKESLVALTTTIMTYFVMKKENITELAEAFTNGDDFQYNCSDNLDIDDEGMEEGASASANAETL